MGEEGDVVRLGLLEGGWRSQGWYTELVDEPWETLPQRFYATPYSALVEEGYEYLVNERSFRKLEKLCDDFLTKATRATRYVHFGVEPLVAYFLAKMNELKILRLLFVGKLHGIEPDTIKERLPDVF
jgi:V/A-type H+-transporting ATPase subunit C